MTRPLAQIIGPCKGFISTDLHWPIAGGPYGLKTLVVKADAFGSAYSGFRVIIKKVKAGIIGPSRYERVIVVGTPLYGGVLTF